MHLAVVIGVAPRVLLEQPVIRRLNLLAVLIELLLEDAVLVLDAVAECRHAQGCEGVDEASSETAKTAIAQARLIFSVDNVLGVIAQFLDRSVELVGQAGVEQSVLELASHQELSAEVADGLGVAVDHVLLGGFPRIHEMLAHCSRCGDVHVVDCGFLRGDALSVLELGTDFVGEVRCRDGVVGCSNCCHTGPLS